MYAGETLGAQTSRSLGRPIPLAVEPGLVLPQQRAHPAPARRPQAVWLAQRLEGSCLVQYQLPRLQQGCTLSCLLEPIHTTDPVRSFCCAGVDNCSHSVV